MPQSLAKNLIHLVFSTKNRSPLLREDLRGEIHAYITTVFKNMDCPVIILNSVEDHIHILFNLHRTISLSEVVKQVKQSSSKWMKTKPDNQSFSWQAGFGAFSVSEIKKDALIKYIQNQQEHHRKVSYQEELREIFQRHGVDYDERYAWE